MNPPNLIVDWSQVDTNPTSLGLGPDRYELPGGGESCPDEVLH